MYYGIMDWKFIDKMCFVFIICDCSFIIFNKEWERENVFYSLWERFFV